MKGWGFLVVGLALVGGCARQTNSGFGDVQSLTSSRIHQTIRWDQNSADDAAVRAATVNALNGKPSVEQVVQIALLNNRGLQAEYAELGIAQADLVEAGLLKNPVFFASVRPADQGLGPDVELSVTEEFIDLITIPMRKKIAAAKFEQAKLQVAGKVIELASEVKEAYFTLAGDEQMLEMRRTAQDAMELSAQTAQKMSDAGNLNELDLANELATAEEAKADLNSATAQVELDREKLIEVMGIDSSATVQVKGRLAEPGEDLSVEQLGRIAQMKRLDLLAAKQAILVAAKSAKLADATRLIPDFELGVDTERNPDGSRVTGPIFQLPIPLFDQGQGTVMRGRAVLWQKQQEYLALARKIGAEVREADQKMVAAKERARSFRDKIIPLRERVVQQAQLHYNGMLLGIFQLLDAKQREVDAGREYIGALKEYWVARCEVEKTVGGNFSVIEMQNEGPTTQQFGG